MTKCCARLKALGGLGRCGNTWNCAIKKHLIYEESPFDFPIWRHWKVDNLMARSNQDVREKAHSNKPTRAASTASNP